MDETLPLDTFPQVNYEKSITRKRLVYKKTSDILFNYLVGYPLACFYIFIGITPLLFKSTTGSYAPMWLILCSVVFTCWMFANLIMTNALVEFNGKDKIINRKNILTALDAFYDNLEYQIDEENVLRSIKPTGDPIWGRIITVLFSENFVYLNITTLGKTENPTFVHGFFNYIKARRIIRYLKTQQV